MRRSLRLKVALAFFATAIVLLGAQALGVRALAEAQEERLIRSVIADDMHDLLASYQAEPASLPPLDPRVRAHRSQEGGARMALPPSLAGLADGVHEVIVEGREVHVAVAGFKGERIYRLYDYSAYERHFREGINLLMVGTGVFVLAAVWLAYWVSGVLVRQVAGLAQQVRAMRSGAASSVNPGRYDEREVTELAEAVNDYHRRMAAMVEREKEFTANVSHELRTPLTAIRTSCELLEQADSALDAKGRQRLRQVEQAAADMQALVECLLALAREDTAQETAPVPLAAAVDAALGRYAERMAQRDVAFSMSVPEEARVLANPSALAVVLSNLVDNAHRHTRHGSIRVSFADGVLAVEDTGSGIAPDALPRVFERFYQAPGAAGQGFGIGLSIVKRICDRYGWPVRVDSTPGAGTCVTIALPVAALHENFTNT
ncbi:HAMP domain-containing sensor histidine kinase [Massilia terrae]|uniref:histidine kinase n=1 Tax=Massilia terrae TaxID=1811224 RepID=A0ABT2CZC9_9BURK|nr:HAMP domain-containing sensor histidine kinase [Massilia terrae]MCS0659322.1 HAMP domain-containing histidine kinase [Massilia terrae]